MCSSSASSMRQSFVSQVVDSGEKISTAEKGKVVAILDSVDASSRKPMDIMPAGRKSSWKQCIDACRDIVQRSWAGSMDGSLSHVVLSKLRRCASSLDVWNRTTLQWLRHEITRTRRRILVAGSETKLNKLLCQDEEYWRQRARTSWLASGDKNTTYFHFKSNQRRKRNTLLGLFNSAGEWKYDIGDIKVVVHDYFKSIFDSYRPNAVDFCTVSSKVTPKVTPAMN
ncbi:hypothetical protein ACOSQ3_005231 [Xanthoceras sorbifolium]